MIKAEELQKYLGYIMVLNDQIECNYCSTGDFVFSYGNSFDEVAEPLLKHLKSHHADNFTKPVTDEEIAELFGLNPNIGSGTTPHDFSTP